MIETEINTFEPVHDVCGADVDIDAYLHGAPENMIEYPLQKTSNIGNVVTLCVDVQYGLNLSAKTIIDRGATIASLAILLERLGHQTELYVSDEYSLRSPISPVSAKWERVMYRVRVKGTKDFIDPAKIMFAYAHPGIQRGMGFTCAQDVRRNENEYGLSDGERYGYNRSSLLKPVPDTGPRMPGLGIQLHNSSFGPVTRTTRDLPEGTIYIDPLLRNTDAPNAELELRRFLMQLGLLREENE
jgi:hypothetical protein